MTEDERYWQLFRLEHPEVAEAINRKMKTIKQTSGFRLGVIGRKIWVAMLLFIAVMGLFPPWTYTYKNNSVSSRTPSQYSFIISPPKALTEEMAFGVEIDLARLLIQWFVVLLLGSVAFMLWGYKH